jgi:hypothetical protein
VQVQIPRFARDDSIIPSDRDDHVIPSERSDARNLHLSLALKDWREVASARATLIFAVLMAPLVGHAFLVAVATYAEVSGVGGGAAALSQGVSPLDGIVVPTFGAYALAASLLFPFVAIRSLSAEKESGALMLLLQTRFGLTRQVVTKFVVLLGAWVVAWIPGLVALALWRSRGGHLFAPEVSSVLRGHLLRGALVISVALVASAVTESAAAAAVLALAFTLGSWALEFVAQVQGGLARQIADLGPEGMLRAFERGEIRADVIATLMVSVAGNLAAAIVWLHPGWQLSRRWAATALIAIATMGLTGVTADFRASRDVSEDRRNSFSVADEHALSRIQQPVRVEVNLAASDPRLADLDREVLRKLRRSLSDVSIVNVASAGTGLFGSTSDAGRAYGEVWYQVGAKRAMTRSTTPAIVLEEIYQLAGIQPPTRENERAYPGYPLATDVPAAPYLFYLLFPALIITTWYFYRR